jgi:hypothetical protein
MFIGLSLSRLARKAVAIDGRTARGFSITITAQPRFDFT